MKTINQYINESKINIKNVADNLSDAWYRYLNNSNSDPDIVFDMFIKDLFNEVSWVGLKSENEAFKIIAKNAEELSK